jgi:flagellar M-ring protein FliF
MATADADLAEVEATNGGIGALLGGLKSLGISRIAAMVVVAVGVLGLLAAIALRGQTPHLALLYADLDPREAGQITEQLDRVHIAYELQAQGSRIMVPAEAVARTRLLLAKDGLPSGGSIGYEIFDRADALTSTQFQQQVNETRALEGELVRSIRSISGVRAARVHLVLAKREPFARTSRDAQASVVLTMAGSARMDNEGVQAVLNLIAAAVPGLRQQNIAIIDSRGNLLARAGQPGDTPGSGPSGGPAQSPEEMRRATELRLSRAVEDMLERTLGAGHVRAEASVDFDFDQVHETEEKFDPDGQVLRSQQTVSDSSHNTEQAANVSVQNNLPNADAAPAAGSQTARQEETNNYEIGKTVRTTLRDQPQLRRVSIAVMVDGVVTRVGDKSEWHERSPEDLARITSLVKSAVGFDEKRGDRVEVDSMHFMDADAANEPATSNVAFLGLERPELLQLAESGLFGLVAILALLLVARPLVLRLTASGSSGDSSAEIGLLGGPPSMTATGLAIQGASISAASLVAGGQAPAGLLESDAFIQVNNVEGQLRASSIRRITQLAEKHPDETLALVRAWMSQGDSH